MKRLSLNEIDYAIEEESVMPLPPPLSNDQLAKLREASQKKGSPITDAEEIHRIFHPDVPFVKQTGENMRVRGTTTLSKEN